MHILRAVGVALLSLRSVSAAAFGTLDHRIAIGQATTISWTADSTDPLVWALAVINGNGETVATVDSVQGSKEQFSLSFPTVDSGALSFLVYQAVSGDEVLATSYSYRERGLDETEPILATANPSLTGAISSTVSSSLAAGSPTQPGTLIIPTTIISQYPPLIQTNTAKDAVPTAAQFRNLAPLIAGPILAVVTVGVVTFILLTICGCRNRKTENLVEP
ncbi:hypothetical protein B0H19DRAFT_1377547 [Mycena capillaripes]|nr:hypothetical protein B0H19DRAFT_1377547 [Mycena capillaripes]